MIDVADLISNHSNEIARLIRLQADEALARVRAAEREAIERLQQVAPVEYDYAAASAYTGISIPTLERRVASRLIKFRKDGRRVFFTKAALDEYKEGLTVEPKPRRKFTL